jgi:hypothetical protein
MKFRLGLDFDGTITRHPDFLRWFSDHLLMSGHEVHIITGRRASKDRLETLNLLKGLRIRYTAIHFYPGDYKLPVHKMTAEDHRGIGEWKKGIMEELGISLYMDDSLHYFDTDLGVPSVHV